VEFPVTTPEQLGAAIRAYRIAKGITQAELGKRIGFAQNAISDFERDPGRSSLRRLYRMLSALHLEMLLREAPRQQPRGKRGPRPPEW
jgi:HTH-type transcriptional regulator/antitoxin HipB